MDKKYIENLENTIKQMLTPLKGVPLKLVIESLSGYKIKPFDRKNKQDKELLGNLIKVANIACKNINKKGIRMARANEVGNAAEPFVKEALLSIKYRADKPVTKSGKKKAMGYPDLEFVDEFGRTNYLEVKTFNVENIATTQRSFYLSPSEDFKVTKNAHHFVVSFETEIVGKASNKLYIYKVKSWKIIDVEGLLVDVKYEFNADNVRLYSKDLILAEGNI